MASINDRWWVKQPDGSKMKSDRYGTGMRWHVRYRNPEGQSRNKSFIRQVDAERFASSIEYELNRGSFFDPKLGQVKFKELADNWFKTRTVNPATIKQNDIHLRRHILPYWGEKPIGAIKNSDIQTWLAQLNDAGLSARYVRLVFANFRLVLEVAVRDDLILKNPAVARNFSFPPISNQRVEVWTPAPTRSATPVATTLLPGTNPACVKVTTELKNADKVYVALQYGVIATAKSYLAKNTLVNLLAYNNSIIKVLQAANKEYAVGSTNTRCVSASTISTYQSYFKKNLATISGIQTSNINGQPVGAPKSWLTYSPAGLLK